MNRTITVKTEMHRLISSKPVHAAAGMGVLASQALRGLPSRVARWRGDTSLPARAGGYMSNARARASAGYSKLADRGKIALNGQSAGSSSHTTKSKSS